MKKIIIGLIVAAVVGLAYYFISSWQADKLNRIPYLAHGNGRVEATEINISARLSGKVEKIRVLEGDRVKANEVLVVMQTNVLVADLARAEASREQAKAAEVAALAKIQVQEANLVKAKADLEAKKTVENNAELRYQRYKKLVASDATSRQHYETAETNWLTAKSDTQSALANIKEVEANLSVAKADAIGAKANILAAEAEITRIKADIDDSILKAPLDGRVQYRVAEPGEVLSSGGRVLNMVDLTDVYMTFFLPDEIAGKVRIGADARIVLDIDPKHPLPAKITYVADVAQFTPKTVETQVERQKLMFRIKAHINRALLEKFIDGVKTGMPGVAWVKLDNSQPWPKELEIDPKEVARINELYKRNHPENALKPSEVIDSKTKEAARSVSAPVEKMAEKAKAETAGKNITKQEAIDYEVKTRQMVDSENAAAVNKEVSAAQKAEQKKQATVDQGVELIKKQNEAEQKATIIINPPNAADKKPAANDDSKQQNAADKKATNGDKK